METTYEPLQSIADMEQSPRSPPSESVLKRPHGDVDVTNLIDNSSIGAFTDTTNSSIKDEDEDEVYDDRGECDYYEESEPFPEHAAYDKEFEQVGRDLVGISKRVTEILNTAPCQTERLDFFRENADRLSCVPKAKREKVALLGNTGAGKSSLLNSILGLPDMAQVMAGGASCTYVGTEYEAPFPEQTTKFSAKVEYFDNDAIQQLLDKLMSDYCTWRFEPRTDWDQEVKQDNNRLFDTAIATFTALFCDKMPFMSSSAVEDYLDTQHQEAVDLMIQWCMDLLHARGIDEHERIESINGDTQNELICQLDPLVSSNGPSPLPKLWPLVKKVRIGINGPRILQYVTLVDLPGLDDTNRVRVNATLETLRTCDQIWVVAKIDRATTDMNVEDLIMRYGMSYRMAIVCTGTDEHIDPGLAAYLNERGQSVGNHSELVKQEKANRQTIAKLKRKRAVRQKKFDQLDSAPKRKLSDSQRAEARATQQDLITGLDNKITSLEADLKEVQQQIFELLVEARNCHTIRKLKKDKADYLKQGNTLDVFCVSNLHYAAHKGARSIGHPLLTASMTGMPSVRESLLQTAASEIVRSMENFLNHKFTVFIQGIKMWSSNISFDECKELLHDTLAQKSKVETCVRRYVDCLSDEDVAINVRPLENAREKAISAAQFVMAQKQSWRWSTVRAFLRKDGSHYTSVVPKQCWNEQFLEVYANVLRTSWPKFEKKQEALGQLLREDLERLVKDIKTIVQGHPASYQLPFHELDELLFAEVSGVSQACCEHQFATEQALRDIKLDMTQDRETGYLTGAMRDTYVKCRASRGTGVLARTIETFQQDLGLKGKDNPFAAATSKMSSAIVKDAMAKNKVLRKKTENIISSIHRQFESMTRQKEIDPLEEIVRERLELYTREAVPQFEAIKKNLEHVKRRYGL